MFSQAQIGRVWTTIEFEEETETGEVRKVSARFLIEPMKRKEFQARRREQLQASSLALRDAASDIAKGIAGETQSTEDIANDVVAQIIARIDSKLAADESDVELLVSRTHDWRVNDQATGEEVPFSREFLRDLLAYDHFYIPYAQRFGEVCQGAVRKNSLPGPAGSAASVQA